ncbi:MAG: PAS domain-containing protein [Caulobacterales bacterium]|nr:PAS domain-containing protein [Caulobacterales bacterium]
MDAGSASAERLHRLEMAVEAAGLGLWEWNVRTGALTWNPRNRDLFGVDPHRSLHIREYIGLVHPDDREKVRAAYRAARDQPTGGDYLVEHRTAYEPEGKARWVQARGRVIRDAEGPVLVVGSTLDVTDRRTAEERRSLILRELAHRAKNGILIMMTIVAQTARGVSTVKDFEEVLLARLKSMADSQDLVTQAVGKPLRLGDLLERALTPFDPERFERPPELEEVNIPTELVVAMALLLHELSTNAVKYGALSAPTGRVELGIAQQGEGRAVLSWREVDGPPVKPATRKGFGTRLLDVSLRNNGGHVEGVFDPSGFQAKIHFPTATP